MDRSAASCSPRNHEDDEVYASGSALADAIAKERPAADETLEQFLMDANSVAAQARYIARVLDGQTVLFLGDDDHVSVVTAAFSNISAVVFDVDERIVQSINRWKERLQLINLSADCKDLRDVAPNQLAALRQCDSFYVNPPYSSKNAAHGLKAWIDTATEVCVPYCDGIVVMPSNRDMAWVNSNWLAVQEFVTANGYRITEVGSDQQAYSGVHDLGLRSQNLTLSRVQPDRRLPERASTGSRLYR